MGQEGWGETHLLCVTGPWKTVHVLRTSAFTQTKWGCQSAFSSCRQLRPTPLGALWKTVYSPHNIPTEGCGSIYSPTSVLHTLGIAREELTPDASSLPLDSGVGCGLGAGEPPSSREMQEAISRHRSLRVTSRVGQGMGTSNVSANISASSTTVRQGKRPGQLGLLVLRIYHAFQILL